MALRTWVNSDVVAAWDQIADAYQERYRIGVDEIHLGPMVPPPHELGIELAVQGRAVLDYGCGAGQNAIACSLSGADRVVAVDPSPRQLRAGRALANDVGASVDFRLLSLPDINELDDFDLVLSVYALHFAEDVQSVLSALASRLRPGGQLLVSVDHPIRVAGEWRHDEFVLPDYFVEGWQSWPYDFPERGMGVEMRRYRRPVESWVEAMLATGMRLRRLLEPMPAAADDFFGTRSKHGDGDARNVFSRPRLSRIPGSLILVAEKVLA